MINDPDFRFDTEFLKLLTRRPDVDLTVAALEIARDACPRLDFRPVIEWISQRAAELAGPVAAAPSERASLAALGEWLSGRYGLHGDTACYSQADGSFLHRVIETRCGIPISLSVLYMAVAGRLGIDLRGVSAPMHFLTRYESIEGPLFVDAYHGGRILTLAECRRWLSSLTQLPVSTVKSSLKPVRPRCIIIRMLNNLKALYVEQEKWTAAWLVQHRLTALQPTSYRERRDLALISLRANRPGSAIDLFQSCLQSCPDDEKQSLEEQLDRAQSEVARWN